MNLTRISIKLSLSILLICISLNLNAQCRIGTDTTSASIDGGRIFLNNFGNLGTTIGNSISYNSNALRVQDFLGGIWLAGLDESGYFRVNAAQFGGLSGSGVAAFWPGPYTNGGAFSDNDTCKDWDLIFEVTDDEIVAFIDDFNDSNGLSIDDVPNSIKGWPAIGNQLFFEVHGFDLPAMELAPFVDVNADGIYNPLDGDFPNISGATNAYWWVLNTAGNINSENWTDNLNIDFHVLASTFDSNDNVIDNSIVFDISMVNRNEETLDSLFFSYWMDVGGTRCAIDFVGSLPDENFSFAYGSEDVTISNCAGPINIQPSLIGVKLLNGVLAPRVFSENNELVYPAIGESADTLVEQKMSSFKHIYRESTTTEPYETDPYNALQYYNLIQGFWNDGRDQLVNGLPNKFAFPGNPGAPVEGDQPMCKEDVRIESIRTLTSCGPFRLQAGERQTLTYAVSRIFTDDVECADVDILTKGYEDLDLLLRQANITSTTEAFNPNALSVYPNPVGDKLHFQFEDKNERVEAIEIYKTSGQLQQQNLNLDESEYQMNTSSFASGMYFYRLQSDQGSLYTGKFYKS